MEQLIIILTILIFVVTTNLIIRDSLEKVLGWTVFDCIVIVILWVPIHFIIKFW